MTDNKQPELEKLAADLLAAQAEIERMTNERNNKEIERAIAEGQRDEALAALAHIREYWNGDANEQAMRNALEFILAKCEALLAKHAARVNEKEGGK